MRVYNMAASSLIIIFIAAYFLILGIFFEAAWGGNLGNEYSWIRGKDNYWTTWSG